MLKEIVSCKIRSLNFTEDQLRTLMDILINHKGVYASHLERLQATEDQSNLLTKIFGLSTYLNEDGKNEFNVSLAFAIANCVHEQVFHLKPKLVQDLYPHDEVQMVTLFIILYTYYVILYITSSTYLFNVCRISNIQ